MNITNILNGTQTEGTGILALIFLAIVAAIYLAINKNKPQKQEVETTSDEVSREVSPLDVNDEDAVVASLIAAIECRNEYHKNVQVISVRKVN